jgi:hypothetical protein
MSSYFEADAMIDEQVDALLSTFQSPFWFDQHGWFVRCQWNPTMSSFDLYTLPYAFSNICVKCPLLFKSTCLQNNNQQTYDAVRCLKDDDETGNCSQQSDIQFYKLEKLEIQFPVGEHFWPMVPTFSHLISCKIISYVNSEECQNQFQLLLSDASSLAFLNLLHVKKSDSIESLSVEINNRLRKKLDLQELIGSFDEKQCVRFSHLPLAMQYEELHIRVKNRISICHLVKTVPNLRLLFVKCDDDEQQRPSRTKDSKEQEKSIQDELVSWLQQQFPDVESLVRISRWHYTIVLRFS